MDTDGIKGIADGIRRADTADIVLSGDMGVAEDPERFPRRDFRLRPPHRRAHSRAVSRSAREHERNLRAPALSHLERLSVSLSGWTWFRLLPGLSTTRQRFSLPPQPRPLLNTPMPPPRISPGRRRPSCSVRSYIAAASARVVRMESKLVRTKLSVWRGAIPAQAQTARRQARWAVRRCCNR